MEKVTLKKAPTGLLRPGHPWVYRNQIEKVDGNPAPGSLVQVQTQKGRFLGIGYLNPASEIPVRLLSRQHVPIDKAFFKRQISQALSLRERFVRDTNASRLVWSEADGLPGLVVDRYAEVLVVQFLTLGMESLRATVIEALEEVVPSKGIYERSDTGSRRMEGLADRVGWISRECGSQVEVHEKNVRYTLQFGEGHKTGFYLDQRENRCLLAELGIRGKVLDAFCYEGGFGLHLALAGCSVVGVDTQKDAIFRAQAHRRLNGLDETRLSFREGNVFEVLKELEKDKAKFDCVILDPPSFVKKKSALEGAVSGYKEIVLRALKILNEGGFLAVFTCSYHVDEGLLMQTVMSAALDTRKDLKVVKFLKQSADHPVNPFIPETYYLKGFLFHVSSV